MPSIPSLSDALSVVRSSFKLDSVAPAAPTPTPTQAGPVDQFFGAPATGPAGFVLPSLMPLDVGAATEASLAAMSDDQLLAMSETPQGAQALKAMAAGLKQGTITPERQKQIDRVDAATFTPSKSLKLEGSAEDKATYVKMVRQTMLQSPSFAKTMNEINAGKNPVTLKLERNSGTALDSFAAQTCDLSDMEKLPVTPTDGRPEQITRGEVLAHMMKEQQVKSTQTGEKDIKPAHKAAIESENEFRKDLGQTAMRKLPPDDETRTETDFGSIITIHFTDNSHEALLFNGDGNLNGSMGFKD